MSRSLDGRVAIVTGASRGIGKALAIGLAARGVSVVCAARTVTEDAHGLPGTIHATAAEIERRGGRALAVRCDVGRVGDMQALVAGTAERFGRVDVLVNNGADHAATAAMPPGFLAYTVAKAAMERFTTALAPELAGRGIAVNALRPGAVKTELATRELGEGFDWAGWKRPEDVVPAVAWLAEQTAPGFTGRIVDASDFGSAWP